MSQRVIACQVVGEYVTGDGVVIGAAGSHDEVIIELDFSKAGETWDGTTKTVTFTDALGLNPTNVLLTAAMLVTGTTNVYLVPVPNLIKAISGQMGMTVAGVDVEGATEVLRVATELSRFRILPNEMVTWEGDNDVPASAAEQLQAQIDGILDGTSIDSFADVESALEGKQDMLTFDSVPTDGSSNPVTSDGVYDGLAGKLNLSGGTMRGDIAMGNHRISGLVGVINDNDAANKYYVDHKYVTAGQKSGTTLGNYATAEGNATTASGLSAHAEGTVTEATGYYSHAEGSYSKAQGAMSHAEGDQTTASGIAAHAEGKYTDAYGSHSHAEGLWTVATHAYQHVFGAYNEEDPSDNNRGERGDYVEIVGNGADANSRSNARTLDWAGNEVLAGKLTLGTGPTNNMDAATKKYVDDGLAAKQNTLTFDNDPTANSSNPVKSGGVKTALDAKLNLSGGTMTGAIAMGANKITGVGTPTADTDAATKKYVDDAAELFWCSYGMTTAAEIDAAVNAGMIPVCENSNRIYFYNNYVQGTGHLFSVASVVPLSGTTVDQIYWLCCASTATWTYGRVLLASLASPTFTGTPKAPTAAAGTNTTQLATTAFVQQEIAGLANALVFKGVVNAGTDLPATHKVGWTYKVGTAGTYAGVTCEVGDTILCVADGTVASNADWYVLQANIDGAVTGPASAVDARVAVFDGATGKILKDGGYTVSDIRSGKEDTSNKVTSLSSASTDTQYPSAKCVYDLIGNVETLLAAI